MLTSRLHTGIGYRAGVLLLGLVAALLGCDGGAEESDNPVAEASYFNFKGAARLADEELEAMADSPQPIGGSEAWQKHQFLKAVSTQHITPISQDNIDAATAMYERLLQVSPDSKYAPRATLNLGRILELRDYYEDKIDLAGARAWYEKALANWPDDPIIAGEATLRIAGTYIQTLEPEQVNKGTAVLREWLEAKEQEAKEKGVHILEVEPLASLMYYYLAGTLTYHPTNAYMDHPWHTEASNRQGLKDLLRADEIGLVQQGQEGGVYWKMSRLAHYFHDKAVEAGDAEEAKRYKQIASEYYRKQIFETPNSGKAYRCWCYLKFELNEEVDDFEAMIAQGLKQRQKKAGVIREEAGKAGETDE